MPSTVEQLSPSRVKLTVVIPFAELAHDIDKAYRAIASQVNIPGFRKGKVPAAVIDQRFGRGMVLQEAINDAVPTAYNKAIEEANVIPLGDPDVEITKLEDGDLVEFTAEVDVRPEIKLPAFTKLKATVGALSAPDAEVDQRIELMRDRFATATEVDRAAAEGDVVVLDLAATQDGEPVPDGEATGITYQIGSGGMLDGLDEAVTGLKAGESADFTATLVGGQLAGDQADIHVTVTKVSERKLPEVDDEFAQLVSEFDTVAEMRADLATRVEELAKLNQLNEARDRVLEALIDAVSFEVPERILTAELEGRKQSINEQLASARMTLDDYLANANEEAKTAEAFWADLAANTLKSLKAQILLDVIADERAISVEQHELTELIIRKAAQNNTTPEAEAQHMMEHNHLPQWMQEIRRNKALNVLLAEAKVVDPKGKKIEIDSEVATDFDTSDNED